MVRHGEGLISQIMRNRNMREHADISSRKRMWVSQAVVKRRADGDSHLLLGILGKWWQTGFAGPAAVVGCGSGLLQLAPVRVEKPHTFGATHIVPARVRGTREVRAVTGCMGPGQNKSSQDTGQNLSLSIGSNPKSLT